MTNPTVWHGSREEFWALSAVVAKYCTCLRGPLGSVTKICQPHAMLLDQRVLDHLLYVYRSRERFARAERQVDVGGDTSAPGSDASGGFDQIVPPGSDRSTRPA